MDEPLTDEVVDAWLAEHANDPVDHEQVERVRRRVFEAVGIADDSQQAGAQATPVSLRFQ